MKVFLAGATGVLGRRLVRQLTGCGHEVVGLARDARGHALVRELGGRPVQVDLLDADALARAAEGAEAVIHAATAIPRKTRTSASDWALNDRLRREGTRALTEAAGRIGARSYLQQSIVWVARPADGGPFDEQSPPNPGEVMISALDGERIAAEAGARWGFASAVLRCGSFYSHDSDHARTMAQALTKRQLPLIGRGDAIWAMLHVEDAASGFVAAAEAGRSGLWHLVDDQPVSAAEFLGELAARLGAPAPWRMPAWLARLVLDRPVLALLAESTRTSNALARQELGWVPRFPSYREGLDEVVAAWRAEGFLGQRARQGAADASRARAA